MSNAAFYQIETAEIKTHMEKKGVDVKSLFTPPFHHCVCEVHLCLSAHRCMHTVQKLFLCSFTPVFPFSTQNTGGIAIRQSKLVHCTPLVSLCMHQSTRSVINNFCI